jgi:hypothetical protein
MDWMIKFHMKKKENKKDGKLLCWLGFHKWIYIYEDNRKCIKCKRHEKFVMCPHTEGWWEKI